MNKMTIQNISSAIVVLSMPDLHFRRELTPGRSCQIDEDLYNEMCFDPGFNGLIEDHYISIIKVDEENHSTQVTGQAMNGAQIAEMLDKQDVTAFAQFIPKAAQAERDTVVQMAIEKRITQPAFVSLIKKYCGTDVIQAISMQHLAEE